MQDNSILGAALRRILRHKAISIAFFVFYLAVIVVWTVPGKDGISQPLWKSIPYLIALLVVFLYLLEPGSRSLTVSYARVSLILVIVAVPFTILGRFSSVQVLGSFSYIIRANLKFAMLLTFLKDIILSKVLEKIRQRRVKEIALSLALLWIYISWFFAFMYASPAQERSIIRGQVVNDADPNFDSVNSIDIWYFSIATLTTVGYGDLRPEKACRFIACIEMSLGYFLMSIIFGIVAGVALEYLTVGQSRLDQPSARST